MDTFKTNEIPFFSDKKIENGTSDREAWEESRISHAPDYAMRGTSRSHHGPPHHHRARRSVSVEHFVSTLVVVDSTMIHFYQNEHLEVYIMTIMNMVRMTPINDTF